MMFLLVQVPQLLKGIGITLVLVFLALAVYNAVELRSFKRYCNQQHGVAMHNWFFQDQGGTTVVTVEESLQGVFPSLFKGYFQKNLDTGVVTNLTELKAAAEK